MNYLFPLIAKGSHAPQGGQSTRNRQERLKIEEGPTLHLPSWRDIGPGGRHWNA